LTKQEAIDGLHNIEKVKIEDAIEALGMKLHHADDLALTPCGTLWASLKKEDGSILNLKCVMFTNNCQHCGKQVNAAGELNEVEQYIPHVLCKECLDKIETNEIKLQYAQFGQYFLDEDRDNSCDRCHKQFHHTELKRTLYKGQCNDEYLCNLCLEIVEKDPSSELYQMRKVGL
jgi:hypothetical protein